LKNILFIVSEDRYFVSHRIDLAKEALNQGYKVALLTKISNLRNLIESEGIEIIDWSLTRSSYNPINEITSILQIYLSLRKFQPDLVHAVALKPILYTAISTRFNSLVAKSFSIAGLGFIFSSQKLLARILRPLVVLSFRFALSGKRTKLIVQNKDDLNEILKFKITHREKISLIRGAGVNTNSYFPEPEKKGLPIILLPARFLWDKGIGDFVEAARLLQKREIEARYVLVGEPDVHNPENINESQIKKWEEEGIVESWGFQDNMEEIYNMASIVCLPSYREGLPKALLEAASCGRPIVTNNVPGCREVVINEENGFLVNPKDHLSLANALELLIKNKDLRVSMGRRGRKRVLKYFSQEIISSETSKIWRELID